MVDAGFHQQWPIYRTIVDRTFIDNPKIVIPKVFHAFQEAAKEGMRGGGFQPPCLNFAGGQGGLKPPPRLSRLI